MAWWCWKGYDVEGSEVLVDSGITVVGKSGDGDKVRCRRIVDTAQARMNALRPDMNLIDPPKLATRTAASKCLSDFDSSHEMLSTVSTVSHELA